MPMPRRVVRLSLVLVLALAACDDGTAPNGPDQVVPDTIPANASGVLLPGAADAPALAELRKMPPTPVPSDRIVNGLLTTRLDVVISPAATVGQVNAALEATGARIVSMNPRHPFLTLVIESVADASGARQVGDQLVASGAFGAALPAFEADPELRLVAPVSVPPQIIGVHLQEARFPAAWPAAALVPANAPKVPVLVPDVYYNTAPHPDISALTFVGAGGPTTDDDGDSYDGNHGFHVAGILAADHDETLATGAHPLASAIQLLGIPDGGLTWGETLANLRDRFPVTGKFLFSISLGYNDPEFANYSKADRAVHALNWRILSLGETDRFLLITAAGNTGETPGDGGHSSYTKPWSVAARFGDPRPMAFADSVSQADSTALEAVWSLVQANWPGAAAAATNVLLVGNVVPAGTPAASSSREPDLWAVGENVLGPCVIADPGVGADPDLCDGALARYSGTSMAAPQIAGLAAFLWNLQPSLSVASLKARLQEANDRGWQTNAAAGTALTDAYYAVLALDPSVGNATIRPLLLDVAGPTLGAPPNGVFDQTDIEAFLTAFAGVDLAAPDYARYDLNGDGYAAGGAEFLAASFDLDVDGISDITTVTQTIEATPVAFTEKSLTDLQILCYYAYSELYTGDQQARTALLAQPCGASLGEPSIEIGFVDRIPAETPTPLTVLVKRGGAPVGGAAVSFEIGGGSAGGDGTTGADGTFTTDVTLEGTENAVNVVIAVLLPDGTPLDTAFVTLRPDEVVLLPPAEGDVNIYSGVSLSWSRPDSTSGTEFFDYKYDYSDPGFTLYDRTVSSSYSDPNGTFGGSASASLTVEIAGGGAVTASGSASSAGNSSGPPQGYSVWAGGGEAGGRLDLRFQIWGAPTFSVTASGGSNTSVSFGGFCFADGQQVVDLGDCANTGLLSGGTVVPLSAVFSSVSVAESGSQSGATNLSFTLTIVGGAAGALAPRLR